MERKKLSVAEQIEYMRDVKGITFNIVDEMTAQLFLRNNNYYFKLKSYAKNYRPRTGENGEIRYDGVDFGYLQELSTIDSILRKQILSMILDIEHYLKAHLLYDISADDTEDGYAIVEEFLNTFPKSKPESHGDRAYTHSLCEKYSDHLPVWVFAEIISFGTFIRFYTFYYDNKDRTEPYGIRSLLYPVQCLRNAAAHNNCLIYNLHPENYNPIRPTKDLTALVATNSAISKGVRRAKLKHPFLHDFTAMLYVYDACVTNFKARQYGFNALKQIVDERMIRRKEYFDNNENLKSCYIFLKKTIDKLAQNAYTTDADQKRQ